MTPWVTRLIIANVLVYLLRLADPSTPEALAFVPARILERPWTLVTYMFMHGDLGHIAFNMLGLLFFGPRLEAFLDEKRFLLLYGISGLVAALLSAILSPLSAIIGASGAVYGVFLGFARYWPREVIRIWGIFPIEARWMVILMTALSLYGGLGMTMDNIAHFAHLGGFLGAYLYLHFLERSISRRKATGDAPMQVSRTDLQRWASIDREKLHEVNRDELDRIRSKIDTSGAESLTPGEREFMDRFSLRGGE
jgi:membrane associated rhomboid family serine protease